MCMFHKLPENYALFNLCISYVMHERKVRSALKFHRVKKKERKKENRDDFAVNTEDTSESLVCKSKSGFSENLVPSRHLVTGGFRACDRDSAATKSTAFTNMLSEA